MVQVGLEVGAGTCAGRCAGRLATTCRMHAHVHGAASEKLHALSLCHITIAVRPASPSPFKFTSLCTHRNHPALAAAYLTSDDVMASKAHTMQSTIEYMNRKYGSAAGYVKVIGITPSEVSKIRLNMLIKAAPRDLLERLSLSNTERGRRLGAPSKGFGLHRSTYSGDSMLDGSTPGGKNDRFDSASLSGSGGGSGNRTRHLHRRSLSRRKTFSVLSKRNKEPSSPLGTTSKLPEDILINRRVTDVN